MRFCEECGAQLEDDAVFCEECGTRVEPLLMVAASEAAENKNTTQDSQKIEEDIKSGDEFAEVEDATEISEITEDHIAEADTEAVKTIDESVNETAPESVNKTTSESVDEPVLESANETVKKAVIETDETEENLKADTGAIVSNAVTTDSSEKDTKKLKKGKSGPKFWKIATVVTGVIFLAVGIFAFISLGNNIAKKKTLYELQASVTEKDNQISELNSSEEAKKKQLSELQASVTDKSNQIYEYQKVLKDKDNTISSLQKELKDNYGVVNP